MTNLRFLTRRVVAASILLGAVALLAVFFGSRSIETRRTVIPFPIPVYEIEAVSGNHHASLLNLPIGQPGIILAPIPVDVDGDLLPDVTAAINLLDVEGPLHDPPILTEIIGRTIAPNVEINRLPTATILGQPSPPLRINVKLTLRDLQGQAPDMVIRVGYDTGHGGSIPHFWKAVLTGLNDLFNPLVATIDTKGGTQGADTVPVWYEGPLTVVLGLNQGPLDIKADLVYEPWPDAIAVRYASDADGHHIDYRHGLFAGVDRRYGTVMNDVFQPHVPGTVPEVDLLTKLRIKTATSDLSVDARIDRMPRVLDADYKATEHGGQIDYAAKADGRLPDVDIALTNRGTVEPVSVMHADVAVEALPPELHARWSIPPAEAEPAEGEEPPEDPVAEGAPLSVLFSTNDPDDPVQAPLTSPGVGAVEATITNYDGAPSFFTPFVPSEQQYFNMQSRTSEVGSVERLISARVENVRRFTFDEVTGGFDTHVNVGAGVRPLQANVVTDALPDGQLMSATAVIAPLPDDIDVEFRRGSKTDLADPMRITYAASQTTDVDAHVELRPFGSDELICGAPETLCADIDVFDLPATLEARIGTVRFLDGEEDIGGETQVEIDMEPRDNAVQPDVTLHAVVGQKRDDLDPVIPFDDPVPLVADAAIIDLPDHLRMRMVEDAEGITTVDFQTCVPVELVDRVCQDGTEGEIGEVTFKAANFLPEKRPANLPQPSSTAPLYADIAARGIPGTLDTYRFEAAARVTDVQEVRLALLDGIVGVRTALGDGQDLQTTVDVLGVDFDGPPPDPPDPNAGPDKGRTSIVGTALVTPLPETFDVCFRQGGAPMDTAPVAGLPFTVPCENADPFGDGSNDGDGAVTPLSIAYRAASPFGVAGNMDYTTHGSAGLLSDDHTLSARFDFDVLPDSFTAHVQVPPDPGPDDGDDLDEGDVPPGAGTTRIATTGSAPVERAAFAFENRFGGAECRDPEPVGEVLCVDAVIDHLPTSLSAYISTVVETNPDLTETKEMRALFYACDATFDAEFTTATCSEDTDDDEIGNVDARFRSVKGDPEGTIPDFVLREHPLWRPLDLFIPAYVARFAMITDTDADPDTPDEVEMQGRLVLGDIKSLTFVQVDQNFDVATDLGNGVRPLLADVYLDTRPGTVAKPGREVRAAARVAPLPETITMSQHGPGKNQLAEPLEVRYTSSHPVTVDALAEIREPDASDMCGEHGTICAGLHIDRLPTTITAIIKQFDIKVDSLGHLDDIVLEPPPPDEPDAVQPEVRRHVAVTVDALPHEDVALPDIVIDATLGQPDDVPIVAHGEIDAFPKHLSLFLIQTGLLKSDKSLKDPKLNGLNFRTCQFENELAPIPVCVDGTQGSIGSVYLAARNFLVRPLDFPVPVRDYDPQPELPLYVGAAARVDKFEAVAGLTSVRGLRVVSRDGLTGVQVDAGDAQPFFADADFAGLPLGDKEFGDDLFVEATLRLKGLVTLSSLPPLFEVCFRENGITPFPAPSTDFTQPCEEVDPFDNGEVQTRTPLSIAYRAPGNVIDEIVTTVSTSLAGFNKVTLGDVEILVPRTDTRHVDGSLTIFKLPEQLTAHIGLPEEGEPEGAKGPIHARFDYDDGNDETNPDPIDIDFDAEYRVADSVCQDLRPARTAICVAGELENLPSLVDVFLDLDAPLTNDEGEEIQNLRVTANGSEPMNLRNVRVSSVQPPDEQGDRNKVLILEGDIIGLPSSLVGTLHMEDPDEEFDALAIDLVATPAIAEIDVEARNFVAPDPMPVEFYDRDGVPVADDTVRIYQRGDLFKAIIDVAHLRGGAYKTTRNAAGEALGTNIMRIDFGVPEGGPFDRTIRAYVDMEGLEDEDDPFSTRKIFADIVLDQVPVGMDVCFRPKLPVDDPETPEVDIPGPDDQVPAGGSATACDTLPTPAEGAFELRARGDEDDPPLENMDVYALFRMAAKGGSDVLAALAEVTNIPHQVQGVFGDAGAEVQSFDFEGNADGIDDVKLELATFDLPRYGYVDANADDVFPPWGEGFPGIIEPLPAEPEPAHEYGFVSVNDAYMHVKAHLGTAAGGEPGARPTHFMFREKACATPAEGTPAYASFPFYPPELTPEQAEDHPEDVIGYKCILGEFENTSEHPLLIDAVVDKGGKRFAVRDGGLTAVPGHFQLGMADPENEGLGPVRDQVPGDPESGEVVLDGMLPRCGTMADPVTPDVDDDGFVDCAPALVHFESPGGSTLWGTVEYGAAADVDTVRGIVPLGPMAALDVAAVPTEISGETDDPWADWGEDARGARLKLGILPGAKKAVVVNARIDIPVALTIDQVQTWDASKAEEGNEDDAFYELKDLRFHYAIRDENGDVVETIGEVAGMIVNTENNGQTLLARADQPTRGLPIPGELGVDFFDRNDKGNGLRTLQIDLRTSVGLDAGARMVGGDPDRAIDSIDVTLLGVPAVDPDDDAYELDPERPSFRVRAELRTPGKKVNPTPDDPSDDWKDKLKCVFFCIVTKIGKPILTARLDVSPDDDVPARLVEAVVNEMDTTKRGDQIKGYADIDGLDADDDGFPDEARYKANIHLTLDPFHLLFHVGIPIFGSFDMFMAGYLDADLDVPLTHDFFLRENLLHLNVDALIEPGVDKGSLTIHHTGLVQGILFSVFGILLGNPILYGLTSAPVTPFWFYACPTPVHANVPAHTLKIPNIFSSLGVSAWLPFFGPFAAIATYGKAKLILDALLGVLVPPVLCGWKLKDIELVTGTPQSEDQRHPGDSVLIHGHRIPGLGQTEEPSPVDTVPEDEPFDLVVHGGEELALCGDQSFNSLTVQAGGKVIVSTAPGNSPLTPEEVNDCPENVPDNPDTGDVDNDPDTPDVDESYVNVGRLNLIVQEELTIEGELVAAGAPGDVMLTGGAVDIGGTVRAGVGEVTITGNTVDIGGTVDADAVSPSMPFPWNILLAGPVGNGGGGHGSLGASGRGGDGIDGGLTGGGGLAYGLASTLAAEGDIPADRGTPGGDALGGAEGGKGGGSIVIISAQATVTGTLTADGADGADSTTDADRHCAEGDEPNNGDAGGGGGSGGAVVVAGQKLFLDGASISATGGDGGSGLGGWGGGGAGGMVKLAGGLFDDVPVNANGGAPGADLCGDFAFDEATAAGEDGFEGTAHRSLSRAIGGSTFWRRGDVVGVGYNSVAPRTQNDELDYRVFLCGIHRPPEALVNGDGAPDSSDMFDLVMPSVAPNVLFPCGRVNPDNEGELQPHFLDEHTYAGVEESPPPPGAILVAKQNGGPLDEGVWGLYTVVVKNDGVEPENDCPGDDEGGLEFDLEHCIFEVISGSPDMTIGVDNSPPTFEAKPVGELVPLIEIFGFVQEVPVVATTAVSIEINNQVENLERSDEGVVDNVSGIAFYACRRYQTGLYQECPVVDGKMEFKLPNEDGIHIVEIFAQDEAGNQSEVATATFMLDSTAPSSAPAVAQGATVGANGWYTSAPTSYHLDGFLDEGPAFPFPGVVHTSAGPADNPWEYRFDSNDWLQCAELACTITAEKTALPDRGTHRLQWRAVDMAGNVEATRTLAITIDGEAPVTAVSVVPDPGPGEWALQAPNVVSAAEDQFGHSGVVPGFDPDHSDLCDGGVQGPDPNPSGTCIQIDGGPFVPYSGLIELPDGVHHACAYAIDVAGNVGATECTPNVQVDTKVPTGTATVVPAAPDGVNQWYDSVPTVTFSDYDPTGSFEPDGGGFRWRVDNSTEFACTDGCQVDAALLTDGEHTVFWTVVDSAGHRRAEQAIDLDVDTTAPRTYVLPDAPAPDGSNGWYHHEPWIRLAAFDDIGAAPGSGVDRIEYTVNLGGVEVYDGPFQLHDGANTVCFAAVDVAGNRELDPNVPLPRCETFNVDTDDPAVTFDLPAPNGTDGWFTVSPTTGVVPTDAAPGSGVVPGFDTTEDLCTHRPRPSNPKAPSGTCVSVDGSPFFAFTAPLTVAEGVHVLRAYTVDVSGRQSTLHTEVVHVDRSDPQTTARTFPPDPAKGAWWRATPTMVLRAADGDQNAGVTRIEYRFGVIGDFTTYTGPFVVPEGVHTVQYRSHDASGRVEPLRTQVLPVDVTNPTVKALVPSPGIWLRLYIPLLKILIQSPTHAQLRWRVTDNMTGPVRVRVLVYGTLNEVVRDIDGGTYNVTAGVPLDGFTLWDGKNQTITGLLPLGIYHYRVIVTDQAGNVSMSGESKPIQLKLL